MGFGLMSWSASSIYDYSQRWYELGHVAVLYDVQGHREIALIDADDLQDAMHRIEQSAAEYLFHLDGTALPPVNWEMNAQMRAREEP